MICSKCKVEKQPTEMVVCNTKSKTGYKNYCKLCQQKHYKQFGTTPQRLQQIKKNDKSWTERKIAAINELKSAPCMDCKLCFHHAAMDFDHRPGTVKLGNISNLVRKFGLAKILLEIAKCDLVCANCHRIRTFNRLQTPTGPTI